MIDICCKQHKMARGHHHRRWRSKRLTCRRPRSK